MTNNPHCDTSGHSVNNKEHPLDATITINDTLFSLLNDYDMLKAKYNYYLDDRKISKGDIRAFVGLKTREYEHKIKVSCNDGLENHVSAFRRALNDLEKILQGGKCIKVYFRDYTTEWGSENQLKQKKGFMPLLPPPIPKLSEWQPNGLTAISLFTGAFGLDLGFLAAGFDLRFANDIDKSCEEVALKNIPNTPFLLADISEISTSEIVVLSGLDKGQADILIGGPPCQPFSTAGRRQGLEDPRSSPLKEFIRTVNELKPKAFVMEEVTGLESARLKHVPFGSDESKLPPESQKGSVFKLIIEMLKSTGYNFIYKKLNAADYGAPQSRERLIFIGLRDGKPSFPEPTHSFLPENKLFANIKLKTWNTLWEATADLDPANSEHVKLSPKTSKYMKLVPPGGHWRQLPENIIPEAMGGAYRAGGGKMGFYRRLSWDEASPVVVTSPLQKGTMFCHPEQMRPLSIEEYKRIQGFPDDWQITGNTTTKYKLIGNAVPVNLSYAIASHLVGLLKN